MFVPQIATIFLSGGHWASPSTVGSSFRPYLIWDSLIISLIVPSFHFPSENTSSCIPTIGVTITTLDSSYFFTKNDFLVDFPFSDSTPFSVSPFSYSFCPCWIYSLKLPPLVPTIPFYLAALHILEFSAKGPCPITLLFNCFSQPELQLIQMLMSSPLIIL